MNRHFAMRLFSLILLAASLIAAQSTPPRKDIPTIAKTASGAVVSIVMSDKDGNPIAQGSGFLVSEDGVVITNYHVIAEGTSALAKLPDGAFYVVDGVLAFDKARDVAVIKAHGENFRTLTLGNSDRVQVGQEVVAIGNPLSLESTVSNGIVSSIRTIDEEGGKYLQVTAPISPGSSGGPLFNMAGEVVGVTSMHLKGGENLNFAIPINDAKHLLLAKSSKLLSFPNQPAPAETQTQEANAPSPTPAPAAQTAPTARDYYKQLYDAGGFAKLIAEDQLSPRNTVIPAILHYACFNDDNDSEEFFVFTAFRFDQAYSDAAVSLLKIAKQYVDAGLHDGGVMHDPKAIQSIQTMREIQQTTPYVVFYQGDWAHWSSIYPKTDPKYRLGILSADFYKKGVKEGFETWGWDENSGSWVTYSPDTSGAFVTQDWTYRLSIEPTTLRYRETDTVITTAGKGETKAVDSKNYEYSGTCEPIVK